MTTQAGAVQRTDDKKAEDKAKADAYNAADRRLREAHRDELNGYIAEEFKNRNLVWKKRLTEAERAEKTLTDLLDSHPDLGRQLKERYAQMDGQAPTA